MNLFKEGEKSDYLVQERDGNSKPFTVDHDMLGGATLKESYEKYSLMK